MSDRKRIAPTLKVKAKRQALPVQGTEENTPNGLPPGGASLPPAVTWEPERTKEPPITR
jgi:hypothetical protein